MVPLVTQSLGARVGIRFELRFGIEIRIDGGGGIGECGEVEIIRKIGLSFVFFSEENHNDVILVAEVAEVDGAVAVDDENARIGGEV